MDAPDIVAKLRDEWRWWPTPLAAADEIVRLRLCVAALQEELADKDEEIRGVILDMDTRA